MAMFFYGFYYLDQDFGFKVIPRNLWYKYDILTSIKYDVVCKFVAE